VRKKSNIFSARSQRRRQKGGKWANPNSSHVCLAGRQIGRSQRRQTMQISKPKPARCKWMSGRELVREREIERERGKGRSLLLSAS